MLPSKFSSAVSPNGVNSKNLTNEDITRTLQMLRDQNAQRQAYRAPVDYQNYMPATLGYEAPSNNQANATLQAIGNVGDKATAVSLVIEQNRAAKQQMAQAKKKQKLQHQEIKAQQQAQAQAAAAGYNQGSAAGNFGQGSTPGPVNIKGFNVHAPIKSYNWRGYNITLNSSVAGRFLHFLNALSAEGYKIHSFSSYRPNSIIEGTNRPSLHGLGLALDINPTENPVTYNGQNITNLPPGVGALAAKYGLKWGGAWVHSKRDPMHFSVPYGGTE